ncbi:hypothetical protein HY032_01705 [Candidatus Gottesmanbacteria bacterium]|nr:hypothetical protein [Candidatus Gottesmanbacteria bacterium]
MADSRIWPIAGGRFQTRGILDYMADDPVQSVADPNVTDPNIIPSPESASSPVDRPVSTILADSPTQPKTPLADPATDYTSPAPADLSGVDSAQTDSPVATESASIDSSASTVPAKSSGQSATVPTEAQGEVSPPASPPVTDEIAATPPQPEPQVAPMPPPEATSGGSIQDSLTPDQPSQVQPETPISTPSPEAFQEPENPPQSAEIKAEPPQGTQEAPLADPGTPISPKTSFGDLVSDQPSPVSPSVLPQAPQSPQAPKSSFGDLVGKPPAEDPTITIEPIEPPKETIPHPPISPQSPSSTQTVIEAKADFSSKRQQALQTRRKKREDHLAKILTLVSQKGKIHNSDVVTFLRVSQSTATNYLHSLVKDGKIKKEGKAKATTYSL